MGQGIGTSGSFILLIVHVKVLLEDILSGLLLRRRLCCSIEPYAESAVEKSIRMKRLLHR